MNNIIDEIKCLENSIQEYLKTHPDTSSKEYEFFELRKYYKPVMGRTWWILNEINPDVDAHKESIIVTMEDGEWKHYIENNEYCKCLDCLQYSFEDYMRNS